MRSPEGSLPQACRRHDCGATYSHPHPRLTPDGRHVLYTSDVSGYANLYLAPVGEVDDLPVLIHLRPCRATGPTSS